MKKIVLVLLTGLLLTACQSNIIYSQLVPMSSEKWHIDSVARFDYDIADANADYRMLIYVRHTERYPYQNMWLFVDNNRHRDTIEFYLADDRGQWLGEKQHGFIEMPVLLEENIHFPDSGTYHIEIQHGMRDSLLRGVSDIGLEIYRNE